MPERARAREQVEHARVLARERRGSRTAPRARGRRSGGCRARPGPGGAGPCRCRRSRACQAACRFDGPARAVPRLPGAEETYPFSARRPPSSRCAGRSSRSRASTRSRRRISLKCEPELAEQLRADHEAITPGYHLNKRHWNTVVRRRQRCPSSCVRDMVEDSYDLDRERAPEAGTRRSRLVMTTILVTGATDGLGREVARDARRGAARACSSTAATPSARRGGGGGDRRRRACTWPTSPRSPQVRALADELPHVDVLVNNAGLISPERVVTEDGYELTFQVNHLAHFLLTLRLLERSRRAGSSTSPRPARSAPDFGDLMLERGYEPWRAYRQSKLAQIMFSNRAGRAAPGRRVGRAAPGDVHGHQDGPRDDRARRTAPSRRASRPRCALVAEPAWVSRASYFDGLREAAPNPMAARPRGAQAALGRLRAARRRDAGRAAGRGRARALPRSRRRLRGAAGAEGAVRRGGVVRRPPRDRRRRAGRLGRGAPGRARAWARRCGRGSWRRWAPRPSSEPNDLDVVLAAPGLDGEPALVLGRAGAPARPAGAAAPRGRPRARGPRGPDHGDPRARAGRPARGLDGGRPGGARRRPGRAALVEARRAAGPGEVVFAQTAPGNAASLRALLAAGFAPIGGEMLLPATRRVPP